MSIVSNKRSELNELVLTYTAMNKAEKQSEDGVALEDLIHELKQELQELESQTGYDNEHY